METIFSHKPTLEGLLVRLRPIQGQDAELFHRLIQDPDIAVLTGSVHSSTPQQSRWSMESLRSIYEQWSTSDDRLVVGGQDVGDAPRDEAGRSLTVCS